LKDRRVEIVRSQRWPTCIMMPDGHPNPI
jgi:hypothetical protein